MLVRVSGIHLNKDFSNVAELEHSASPNTSLSLTKKIEIILVTARAASKGGCEDQMRK